MNAKLGNIEYCLPESVLSNQQLSQIFPDWSSDKIEEKVGIRERRVVGEDETALDLGYKAAEKVLTGYDKNRIDFIILCTQSPEYYLPSGACILQNKLGLRCDIGAFDYNLGCSGFIYGLAISKGLIKSGIARSVLLVTAETYSVHIHPKDKGNRTIFGDAASASIIEATDREMMGEFVLGTDGSGFRNLIVPNGGIRSRYNPAAEEIDDGSGSRRTDNNLYMNGPEIFSFTIRTVPRLIENVLLKNNTTLEEIDLIICHQANKYILEYLRKKSKIPAEKYYINLLNTGNTVSATIPIAIKDCLVSGRLKPGNKILAVGFGVGYSWGGTVLTIG